jgi:hypothetical protein
MAEPRGNWLWTLFRKKKRSELDRLERDLILGRTERRKVAGDPSLPDHLKVRTRNKK